MTSSSPQNHQSDSKFAQMLGKLWLANAWIITATILLLIPMDEYGQLSSLSNPKYSLLRILFFGTLLTEVILLTYLGGKMMDNRPSLVNALGLLGFVLIILGLIAYTQISSLELLASGLLLIGAGSSLLSVSAFSLLGITAHPSKRGRIVGYTMMGALFPLLLLVTLRLLASQLPQLTTLGYVGEHQDVLIIHGTITVAIISLILSIVGMIFNHPVKWINDQWPTPDSKILKRNSVQLYFLSHFLIYLILGISVGVIARYGTDLELVGTFQGLKLLARDSFWFFVILGDLLFVLPLGHLSDRMGRKPIVIGSIYLLALAVLGLSSIPVELLKINEWIFLLSALIIGISFAGVHVTLDSSVWYDLSPRDAMGRYLALGLISLIIGLGLGRLIGLNIEFSKFFDFNLLGYVMLFVIVLVLLPLNIVDDSYPPLQFILLLVRLKGGLLVFSHDFGKQHVEQNRLDLISGALEAIDTFMQEVLEEGYLRLVQHSTFFILNDGYKDIRVNLICNKSKKEIKDTLHLFTVAFHEKYQNELAQWTGNVNAFREAVQLVENIFGPLMVDFK